MAVTRSKGEVKDRQKTARTMSARKSGVKRASQTRSNMKRVVKSNRK